MSTNRSVTRATQCQFLALWRLQTGRSYLGQQHGQSHDEVLCQFVLIVYLGLPLLCCQHLNKNIIYITLFYFLTILEKELNWKCPLL